MLGFELPMWVHIIVLIIAVVVSGFICVDKNNKVDNENVGLCVLGTLVIVFFWQIALGIAAGLGILYIPFYVGMILKKMYFSYKEKKDSNANDPFTNQQVTIKK